MSPRGPPRLSVLCLLRTQGQLRSPAVALSATAEVETQCPRAVALPDPPPACPPQAVQLVSAFLCLGSAPGNVSM